MTPGTSGQSCARSAPDPEQHSKRIRRAFASDAISARSPMVSRVSKNTNKRKKPADPEQHSTAEGAGFEPTSPGRSSQYPVQLDDPTDRFRGWFRFQSTAVKSWRRTNAVPDTAPLKQPNEKSPLILSRFSGLTLVRDCCPSNHDGVKIIKIHITCNGGRSEICQEK